MCQTYILASLRVTRRRTAHHACSSRPRVLYAPPLHCSASVLLRCGLCGIGHPNTALRTASISASTSSGFAQTSTTSVGSFNMLPVVIQTIRSSASISPSASETHFIIRVYQSIHLVRCLRTAFASLKIILRFISLDALTLSFVWA